MKKILLSLLAISSILSGCNNSDNDNNNELVPIVLTSNVVIEGRERLQNIQIAAGQQVSFFVTRTGNLSQIEYDNALLTADGNGNFSYSSGGQTTLYYPVDPVNVDFFAIHPYKSTASLSSVYDFEVLPDQTTLTNYYNSDLLYSFVDNIERTRNAVPMVFNHKLSKISLTIKEGTQIDLTNLTNVEMMNVQYQIGLTTSDGSLVPVAGNETTIRLYGVRGVTGSETQVSGITGIIVPQSFVTDGTKQLFRLTINGIDYFYRPENGILYEEGKIYNYTLTVNNTGIVVTSSIEDWLPGEDITGEAD